MGNTLWMTPISIKVLKSVEKEPLDSKTAPYMTSNSLTPFLIKNSIRNETTNNNSPLAAVIETWLSETSLSGHVTWLFWYIGDSSKREAGVLLTGSRS